MNNIKDTKSHWFVASTLFLEVRAVSRLNGYREDRIVMVNVWRLAALYFHLLDSLRSKIRKKKVPPLYMFHSAQSQTVKKEIKTEN